MANYPKFELVGNEKGYLDHVWSTKLWDVSQMPSKLYMRNKDGSLVAIRPMFFVSLKSDREYVCGTSEIFGFEKAGEGLCVKRVDTYFPSYDFFVSPEDYERYKAGGDGAYQIPILFTTDILREHDYIWTSNGIRVWREENGEPKRVLIPDYRLWIDRDGAHIEPLTAKGYFKTREECARTIPKAQVVDFDDEDPEPEGIMDETNGHDPDLVKRINEAWDMHQCWWEFTLIVGALMHRDGSQILDCLDKEVATYADDEKMVAELGPEYLQHIADNQDLKQILDFIGR